MIIMLTSDSFNILNKRSEITDRNVVILLNLLSSEIEEQNDRYGS
jgi:hypothetical protein